MVEIVEENKRAEGKPEGQSNGHLSPPSLCEVWSYIREDNYLGWSHPRFLPELEEPIEKTKINNNGHT